MLQESIHQRLNALKVRSPFVYISLTVSIISRLSAGSWLSEPMTLTPPDGFLDNVEQESYPTTLVRSTFSVYL
jgi:hypothetical protein